MEGASDEYLMKEYQRGNKLAFELLYYRYSGKVNGYLYKRLADPMIADELFQTVFLKLHQARSKYSASFPFLPWLFTICKNTLIDHYKKSKIVCEYNIEVDSIEAPIMFPQVKDSNRISEIIPSAAVLPVNQQKAIELRYLENNSFAEISKTLNTSTVNVRQLVSRGVRRLNVILKRGQK